MKKLSLLFCMVLFLVGCSKQETPHVATNHLQSLYQGDYSFDQNYQQSKQRILHQNYLQNRQDMDAIGVGMLDYSKEYFPVSTYIVANHNFLDYDQLKFDPNKQNVGLLDRNSTDNPYGLNPSENSEIEINNQKIKAPVLINDLYELNFRKESQTEIEAATFALVFNTTVEENQQRIKIPFNQLLEFAKNSAHRLQRYLDTIQQVKNIPYVVLIYFSQTQDNNIPGNFVYKLQFKDGKLVDEDKIDEQFLIAPSSRVEQLSAFFSESLKNFSKQLQKTIPQSVGVVAKVHYRDQQIYKVVIDITFNPYTKFEEIALLQKVNKGLEFFENNDYNIIVKVHKVNKVIAGFEKLANETVIKKIKLE